MNKTAAKICIAAFSILFVFCLAALVAGTMMQIRTRSVSSITETAAVPQAGSVASKPAASDAPSHTHTTDPAKEAAIADEITKLDISMISGKINVLKSPDATIRIAQYVTSPVPGDQLFISSVSGKTLTVTDGRNGFSFNWGLSNMASFELDVYLPEKSFEEIKIKTTSGDADAQALLAKSFIFDTTSGDISLTGSFDNLDLDSTSGDFDFGGSAGVIKSSSVSGESELRCSTMPVSIRASSTSGGVSIGLPENDGFAATFHKVSGDFHCSFPTAQAAGAYLYKQGGTPIDVSTVSGDLDIYQLDTESI